MKKLLILLTIIISLNSCQKEEPIQCWGIVRTINTTKMYWNETYDFDIQQDTSFQCGITEYELDKQCYLNNKVINDDQTSIRINYTFYPK